MNEFVANPTAPTPTAAHPQYNFDQSQKAFVDQVQDAPSLGYHFSPAVMFALVAAGLILVELVISWILVATQQSALATKQRSIDTSTAQIAGPLKTTDALATQITEGLKVYATVKTQQRNFNPLWDDLRKRIAPNTRFKTLAVDDKGVVKIDGEAKTFSDISKLIASLNKSQTVKTITVNSTNSNDKTVDFSLNAKFNPVVVAQPVTPTIDDTQGAL